METNVRYRAVSPTGEPISRVAMVIRAHADVYSDSFYWDEYGQLMYDHAGATEVIWETADVIEGAYLVDDEGYHWKESEIKLVPIV